MPDSLDEAYVIQDVAIELAEAQVLGWKLALIAPEVRDRWPAERIAGPVFVVEQGDDAIPELPLFARGYAAAEAEFQLRIGHVPTGAAVTMEEAADAIDMVSIGIEAAGSPFAGINQHGPAVTISDFGNNNGIVIGCPIHDWRNCGATPLSVTSRINGAVVGTGNIADLFSGPIAAARFLFELSARRGISLAPGQWISSGAITGAHRVCPGDHFEAHFGDIGRVSCRFSEQLQ